MIFTARQLIQVGTHMIAAWMLTVQILGSASSTCVLHFRNLPYPTWPITCRNSTGLRDRNFPRLSPALLPFQRQSPGSHQYRQTREGPRDAVGGWHQDLTREKTMLFTLLELCVSSLRRGHANIICIVPSLMDDPRRESSRVLELLSLPPPYYYYRYRYLSLYVCVSLSLYIYIYIWCVYTFIWTPDKGEDNRTGCLR